MSRVPNSKVPHPIGKSFVSSDEQNSTFWIKPQQGSQGNQCCHFEPFTNDIQTFWQSYITNPHPSCHVQYRNNPSEQTRSKYGDQKFLSGITIDSDLYVRIDECDYISKRQYCKVHSKCGSDQLEDGNTCQNCAQIQIDFKKALQEYSQEKLRRTFDQFINKRPFIPNDVDIAVMKNIVSELISFIKDHFKLDQGLLTDDLFDYTLMCRDNISTDKRIQPTGGRQNYSYYRYGFHIYMFKIKLDNDGKQYIKNHFQFSSILRQDIMKNYPTTDFQQIFDRAPLTATTSLPLSSTGQKNYNYCYDIKNDIMFSIDMDDLNDDDDEEAAYIQQVLHDLNPFGGTYIRLQSQFIQLDQSSNNLIQFLTKKEIKSYEEAIHCIRKNLQQQFKEDFQLQLLLDRYGHPDITLTGSIVKQLFGFLYDDKKVNHSKFIIQQCMFIIMCENVEDIIRSKKEFIPTDNWIEAGRERRRYPISIVSYVDSFKIYNDKREHERNDQTRSRASYKKLFTMFNEYKTSKGDLDDVIEFDLSAQISFKDFMNFLRSYASGFYFDQFFRMLNNKSKIADVRSIIFQYSYQQLEKNMVVDNDKFYFFRESDNDTNVQDNNKFHLIQQNEIEGKLVYIYDQLKQGVIDHMLTMKQENENYQLYIAYDQADQNERKLMLRELDKQQQQYIQNYNNYSSLLTQATDYTIKITKQTVVQHQIQKLSVQNLKSQMDQGQGHFGVYNGVLSFNNISNKFTFHQGQDAKAYNISKSTLFAINKDFIDENSQLKEPDQLSQEHKQCYDIISDIANKIYNNGKDIEVLQWKIYNIILRMLTKNIPGEKLLIAFGTGGDGKTTMMQAICNALGQGQGSLNHGNQQRKIISDGYTAQSKSTILQEKPNKPNQHDQGGNIQLYLNYFCLMTELASSQPLATSSIKDKLCGTMISARGAYDKSMQTFFNTCMMELQTNYYPTFDQVLDEGLKRRVLFYQHKVKFIAKHLYDKLNPQQREKYVIADENVRNNLNTNPDYLDMLGYYMLIIYQNYQHRSIDYVPQLILNETTRYFDSSLIYMNECMNLFKTSQVNDNILYEDLQKHVSVYIEQQRKQKSKNDRDYEQILHDHLSHMEELKISDIYAINIQSKEEISMTRNDLQQYTEDKSYIIVLKGHVLVDDVFQVQTEETIRNKLNGGR